MRDRSLSGRSLIHLACVIAGLLRFALLDDASADEAGVSFSVARSVRQLCRRAVESGMVV